jgi:8-oxo-dGTP pyrophosphatase MutT (NUDIX family)
MNLPDLPKHAACAFVLAEGGTKVLAVTRRDTGLWSLPGGKVDPGETTVEALVRELKEETGLIFTTEWFEPVYSEVVVGDDGHDFYSTAYWFVDEYDLPRHGIWSVEEGINVSFIPLMDLLMSGAFSEYNYKAVQNIKKLKRFQEIRDHLYAA